MKERTLLLYMLIITILVNMYVTLVMMYHLSHYDETINKLRNENRMLIERIKMENEIKFNRINNNVEQLRRDMKNIEYKIDKLQKDLGSQINNIKHLIKQVNPYLSDNEINKLARIFYRVSKQYDIPLEILLSVAYTESHFNLYAYNKETNCFGIMQVNIDVWTKKGIPEVMIKDPYYNIEIGAIILRYYYDLTGNWNDAIIRYYGISEYAKKVYVKIVQNRINFIKSKLGA